MSSDNKGYIIPSLFEEEVEKEHFVPLSFAQEKLKSALVSYSKEREEYNKTLNDLNEKYKENISRCKVHYEALINEVKNKALEHIDLTRKQKKQIEDDLSKEIKVLTEQLEETRDSSIASILQYQEELRKLKSDLSNALINGKQLSTSLESITASSEVKTLLSDMLRHLEMEDKLSRETGRLQKEMDRRVSNYNKQLNTSQSAIDSLRNDVSTRMICSQTLSAILLEVEKQSHLQLQVASQQGQQQQLDDLKNRLEEAMRQEQMEAMEKQKNLIGQINLRGKREDEMIVSACLADCISEVQSREEAELRKKCVSANKEVVMARRRVHELMDAEALLVAESCLWEMIWEVCEAKEVVREVEVVKEVVKEVIKEVEGKKEVPKEEVLLKEVPKEEVPVPVKKEEVPSIDIVPLQQEEQRILQQLNDVEKRLKEQEKRLQAVSEQKEVLKGEIKDWNKDFADKNGKEAVTYIDRYLIAIY